MATLFSAHSNAVRWSEDFQNPYSIEVLQLYNHSMRILIKVVLLLMALILVSCGEGQKSVVVESEKIDNFSDLNYREAKDIPYFNEIKRFPFGFSLGDYSDYGSILFLTESANIFPFDDENLKYFLTQEELSTALATYVDSSFSEPVTRKIRYYPYGRLVTKNYVLLIINKRNNQSYGRDYEFKLKTYTFAGELIDEITMAKWDHENEQYFGGWILPGMQVKREFYNGEVEYFQIDEAGRITEKI